MSMFQLESRPTDPMRLGKIALGAVVAGCLVWTFAGPTIAELATTEGPRGQFFLRGDDWLAPSRCVECGGRFVGSHVQGVPCVECEACGFKMFPQEEIQRVSATTPAGTTR